MADYAELERFVEELSERPDLLERISGLISAKSAQNDAYVPTNSTTDGSPDATRSDGSETAGAMLSDTPHAGERHRLLGALKPYLSDGRARAIDTLLGISDIFGIIKPR